MSKVVKILKCTDCPNRFESEGGITGDYYKCLLVDKEIHGEELDKMFPSWCPLKDG